jgi:hypothetical protein
MERPLGCKRAALGKRKLPEKLPACPSRFRDFGVIEGILSKEKPRTIELTP